MIVPDEQILTTGNAKLSVRGNQPVSHGNGMMKISSNVVSRPNTDKATDRLNSRANLPIHRHKLTKYIQKRQAKTQSLVNLTDHKS